jgi:hypothetical protein
VTLTVYRNPGLGDFLAVCLRLPEDEREQFEVFTGEAYDAARVAAAFSLRDGPSWVVMDGKIPIIVAGFDMIRPGVWQDWLFSTPEAWDALHWRSVTKICKKAMDALLRTDAHRLQCVSLASRIHAHRWYRPLGLTLEGTLRGYGVNGEDALMFSRLRIPDNG